MLGVEAPREVDEQATGRDDVCAAIGAVHNRLHQVRCRSGR
jgi:hypothetical protein